MLSLDPTPSATTPILAGVAGVALLFSVVGFTAFMSRTYPFHRENQASRLPKTPFREFVNSEYVGIPGTEVPEEYARYLTRS